MFFREEFPDGLQIFKVSRPLGLQRLNCLYVSNSPDKANVSGFSTYVNSKGCDGLLLNTLNTLLMQSGS